MTPIAYAGLASVVTALCWTLWLGVRRRDAAVLTNGLASLGAVGLPAALELLSPHVLGVDLTFGVALPTWIAVAGLLHMLGMLGWYDRIGWWDNVTHAVSAALVAAVVYAWVLVVDPNPPVPAPLGSPAAVTLALTMLAGAFWELLEWAARLLSDRAGIERVLKHYGRYDTPLDIVFDLVGAVLVVALDVRRFVPAFDPVPGATRTLLWGWIVVLVMGSVASAAVVVYGRRTW